MGRYPDYRFAARTLVIACVLMLAGCATAGMPASALAPQRPAAAPSDPLEHTNRGLFALGNAIDRAILRPFVLGYQQLAPGPLRRAVHNLLQNADEPLVFLNDVLQARFAPAGRTALRFVGNSTIGLAGLFDPATGAGLAHHDNDFGQTLGRYGFGPGAYLYVPLIGPTSVRDLFGSGVDFVADPLSWTRVRNAKTINMARTGLSLVDDRLEAEADLRALEATAADPYATLRSVYLQSREAAIKGDDAGLESLPDLPSPPPPTSSEPTPPGPTSPGPAEPQP